MPLFIWLSLRPLQGISLPSSVSWSIQRGWKVPNVKSVSGRQFHLIPILVCFFFSISFSVLFQSHFLFFFFFFSQVNLISHGVGKTSQGRGGSDGFVLMLMPLCSRGSLYDEIVNRYPTKQYFTDRGVLKIFEEVCHGVAVLHSKRPRPIIHRDLKVENVLFDEHLQAQVCDFGSATDRYISPTSMRKDLIEEEIQAATTLVYRAPECIEFFSEYLITEKMDIWALGCVLFKTMYFEDAFAEGALAIVNVKPATPPAARQFSRALQELYAWLWTERSEER